MTDEYDESSNFVLKNNDNYASKVTIVASSKKVKVYKLDKSALRFVSP